MKQQLAIFLFLLPIFCIGQIQFKNSSFEDEPQDATMPTHWKECEFGTTPDILPGFWNVELEPYGGESYVGLITRDDGTYEGIGQELETPLTKKECYTLGMYLAHSKTYMGYNVPVRLRIYGGSKRCQKKQLLVDTDVIDNTEWEYYQFDFIAKREITFITIEAFFAKGIFFHYKGNVLVDELAPFKVCQRAMLD